VAGEEQRRERRGGWREEGWGGIKKYVWVRVVGMEEKYEG
jgi:hypothetical protein